MAELITCYLILGKGKRLQLLSEAVIEILRDNNCKIKKQTSKGLVSPIYDAENDISKSDFVIAEVSDNNPETYYILGLAAALGKNILMLFDSKATAFSPLIQFGAILYDYDLTNAGIEKFKKGFNQLIKELIKNPLKYMPNDRISKRISNTYIDLDKLEPREFDNLCFELISQLGFRKVSWGNDITEIDLVATLTKKDPDGFEYQELWLITMGNRMPKEFILDMLTHEPQFLTRRLLKGHPGSDLFSKSSFRADTPVTILFILKENESQEFFEKEISRAEVRLREKSVQANLRFRLWEPNYLIKLIQQHKQIAYKYFSERTKTQSKYRKSQEELYTENVSLSDELIRAKNELEEEKKKRFIAEREMAWKDVSFKAAHKLGNPVDASDTFLQSLKRKLKANDIPKAIEIAENMDKSLEDAKSVIGQFKSLTKLEEIKPVEGDIVKTIEEASKSLQEKGVNVQIQCEKNIPKIYADFEKLKDCFDEILANACHWFDKKNKKISIIISKIDKNQLPANINPSKQYLSISFNDNGCGVKNEDKEKIFSPFFTTFQHGSGIGLSIVRKIIDLHEGVIFENGKPVDGASFTILIPIGKRIK